MKKIIMIAGLVAMTASAQQVSFSSLPDSSKLSAMRAYYAQTGQTNLVEVLELQGSASITIPNRYLCTTCAGRGVTVKVVAGEDVKASSSGFSRRGKTTSSGHTGRRKGMDRRYLIPCTLCKGDGKTDQTVRIVK